jgi:hypothetical protein
MRRAIFITALACLTTLPLAAQAADRPRAEALVKEGHAFLKANGRMAFVMEVQKASGKFHTRPGSPLYLFVYDLNGVVLAHGAEANLLGVNRLNVKDPDGTQYTKEFIATGQKKGGGWVDYKRMNPETRQIEHKTSFVLAVDGVVVGCGIYK